MEYNLERMFGVAGEVAVVVGASGCVGTEICRALSALGAKLVLVGRKEEALHGLAASLGGHGGETLVVPTDITCKPDVQRMARVAIERFGRIDILVNSAGHSHLEDAVSFEERDWDQVVGVNLKGTFLTCQAVGPQMIRQGGGRIVNLSSVRGLQGRARDVAYAPSKGAINQLTRSLAIEWARHGVSVNAIAPTFIRSSINEAMLDDPEVQRWVLNRIPMGRLGEARDLIGLLVFLCSASSEFITGQVFYVDGGWTAA